MIWNGWKHNQPIHRIAIPLPLHGKPVIGDVRLYQVDAFSSAVFSGNPAAVCMLDGWIDDRRLQYPGGQQLPKPFSPLGIPSSASLRRRNLLPEKQRTIFLHHRADPVYAYCLPVTWDYAQDHPYKKDTIKADRRMYLHLYYCPDRALEDEKAFNSRMVGWQEELESGQRHPDHEK